ncbi:MAG: pilus assembly protein TadG-related protein [Terriglobales bacterium]|jgi:hypothetical protein
MPSKDYLRRRRSQRGQTILLIAISMVSLLAMAALAIDVVTLYVARTEVQRAADAAALAGAKAIADSGLTTLPPADGNLPNAKTLAQSMATSAINAVVSATPPINRVAGSPPTLVGVPNFNFVPNNNPTVTVILQQTNLPTFFARIWGQSASTTSASATAEAYNPSNLATSTPITPSCVKPWLVVNLDPNTPGAFINPVTGAINAGSAVIGEQFYLADDCTGGSGISNCSLLHNPPSSIGGRAGYVPALVAPNTANICPAAALGLTPNEQSIECCDVNAYACGNATSWASTVNPKYLGRNTAAVEQLIHATGSGTGVGQDSLLMGFPDTPPDITAGSGPMNGQTVTTSSSIVTIPIMNNASIPSTTGPVTIVGFFQAFIDYVGPPGNAGDMHITVMNIVGCSSTPNGNAPVIGGNGASAIPVRLISSP